MTIRNPTTARAFEPTPRGMTPADVDRRDILAFMGYGQWYRTAELCEEMVLTRARITRLLHGMAERGWIRSRPCGALDLEWARK